MTKMKTTKRKRNYFTLVNYKRFSNRESKSKATTWANKTQEKD